MNMNNRVGLIKTFSVIIFCFLLIGCEEDRALNVEIIKPTEEEIVEAPEKKPLEDAWYKKIDITLIKEAPVIPILKNIAQKFNLKLLFNVEQIEGINYCAKDKPFIEILSDICDINGWKLRIKKNNGKISTDTPYMNSYCVLYLMGEKKGNSDTSATNNIDHYNKLTQIHSGSNAKLSNEIKINPFEELQKNIEMIATSIEGEGVKFSIHKQAGVLNVVAKQKIHKMVMSYINLLARQLRNQILIEARIYEIELFERFETGVNWSPFIASGMASQNIPIMATQNGAFRIGLLTETSTSQIEGNILSFLRQFGKVNSISNPRVTIANNSFAIFKIVDNKVFFKLRNDYLFNPHHNNNKKDKNNQAFGSRMSSEIHTVPVGVILAVQPSIDANGRIMISLHSIISEVHDEIDDPAAAFISNDNSKVISKIPIIKTRELDTVFSTKEDKVAIIGGLLYSKKKKEESGFPIWVFGGKKQKLSEKKEIVIAIKAKIGYCPQNFNELVFLET